MNENLEVRIWKGCSSQWLNLSHFTGALLLAMAIGVGGVFMPLVWFLMIIPLLWMGWRYLVVRCHSFEMTNERIRIAVGIINQRLDEVELYRVKDILVERKWWMRLTGLGTISIQTSDRSLPVIVIPAIKDSLALREDLRRKVEIMRDRKRVREMDFEESAVSDGVPE